MKDGRMVLVFVFLCCRVKAQIICNGTQAEKSERGKHDEWFLLLSVKHDDTCVSSHNNRRLQHPQLTPAKEKQHRI